MARGPTWRVRAPTSIMYSENTMKGRSWRQALVDDSGQDLIEYGLLASIIVVGAALIFPSLKTAMGKEFVGWGKAVDNLWTPKDPGT